MFAYQAVALVKGRVSVVALLVTRAISQFLGLAYLNALQVVFDKARVAY
jgi:hypothetical protein